MHWWMIGWFATAVIRSSSSVKVIVDAVGRGRSTRVELMSKVFSLAR